MNLLLDANGTTIASGKGSDFHHVAHDERVVKERPILFSAPMVRSLLSGAKTQTRRVVNLQAEVDEDGADAGDFVQRGWCVDLRCTALTPCPVPTVRLATTCG
jgi:hypothetical protein